MESVSKVGDIVIMQNGERYIVLDCIEYENEMYLKVSGVIKENKDDKYVSGFVKEIISSDDKYSLEIVNNKKIINELNAIMIKFSEEDSNKK